MPHDTPRLRAPAPSRFDAWRSSAVFWPLVALVALLLLNIIITPNFSRIEIRTGRAFGSIIDILQNGSLVMLLSIGMTLVIAIAGIDLSVGSVMALAATAAALLITGGHPPLWIVISAPLALAAGVGAFNGLLIGRLGLQPIVATLVTLVAARGTAQTLSDDQKVRFDLPAFQSVFDGLLFSIPTPILFVLALAVVVALVLRLTTLGMDIEAIGASPRAARLCGLRVELIRVTVYAFCALCAGLAGLVAAADIKEADVASCGLYLELDAILAVVIGGTSLTGGRPHIAGSLIGALLMQTLTVMLQMHNIPTEQTLIVKAAVAILVCLLQSPTLKPRFFRSPSALST
jgi:ribose/xylose/arabinose/galactoside ABC-type transport system permease subunit